MTNKLDTFNDEDAEEYKTKTKISSLQNDDKKV